MTSDLGMTGWSVLVSGVNIQKPFGRTAGGLPMSRSNPSFKSKVEKY